MAAPARYERQFTPNNVPLGVQKLAYADPLEGAMQTLEKFAERGAIERGQSDALNTVLSGGTPTPHIGLTPGGVAYNEAAERALTVRSEGILRTKAAELATQYDGRNPTDADAFAEIYGGIAKEVVDSVPERWRGPIAFEAQTRVAEAVSKILGASADFEYSKNVKSISDGFELDIQDSASAEQIGRADLADAALAKSEDKLAGLLEIGAVNADQVGNMRRDGREKVAAEGLYHGFLTGRVSLQAVQSGAVGAELSPQVRTRLVNQMESEITHRNVESERAERANDKAVKEFQAVAGTKVWRDIWTAPPGQKPSIDTVQKLQEARIIDADEAQQMMRTLATTKEARTDLPTLSGLDEAIDRGEDVSERVSESVRAGTLHPDDAESVYSRNRSRQDAILPDEIEELRKGSRELFTESGKLAGLTPGEASRKVSAVRFFDEQVRDAPDGTDPETGLTYRTLAARRAYGTLQQRSGEQRGKALFAIPPRNAILDEKPGQPPRLRIGRTVQQLRIDRENGILTREEYLAELALISQWEQAGLTVK